MAPVCLPILSCPGGYGVILKPLFALFWQLCRFQKGPQDVPYSPVLLVLLVLAEMALALSAMWWLQNRYLAEQALGMLVATGAWFVMVWGLLRFKGFGARYIQVMTACLGTDLVISVIVLPLQVFMVTQKPEGGLAAVMLMALMLAFVWDILVKGRIYRAALGLGRLQANLLSISIWILVLLLSDSFLPPEARQAGEQQAAVAPASTSAPESSLTPH